MAYSTQDDLQAQDPKVSAKRIRLIIFCAVVLGVLELGVWSYKHQNPQKLNGLHSEQKAEQTTTAKV